MSKFIEIHKKGLSRCMVAASLEADLLSLHISEIAPGTRAHAAHAHNGIEAFYVLEGSGAVETEGETIPVESNQTVILDASQMHGLVNTGSVPMRYLVIISKP